MASLRELIRTMKEKLDTLPSVIKVATSEVSHPQAQTIELSPAGRGEEVSGDIYFFQYRESFTASDTEITVSVHGSTPLNVSIQQPDKTRRNMTLNDIAQYNFYGIYRAPNSFHLIAGTLADVSEYQTEDEVNTLIAAYGEAFTTSLLDKLNGIEAEAKDDQTADEIVDLIEALAGNSRLDNQRLRNLSVQRTENPPDAANARGDVLYYEVNSDDRVQRVKFKDSRKTPFFDVTVADLGDGHRGRADSGYDALADDYDVDAGGSAGYSALGAISEQYANIGSATFSRVGSYTIDFDSQITIRGLASHDYNLYVLLDTNSGAIFRSYNPETGTVLSSTDNIGSSTGPRGFTILNGIAYWFDGTRDYFFSYDIESGTLTALSEITDSNIGVGLANLNGRLYYLYLASNQAFIAEIDLASNSVINRHRLTGYNSNDDESLTRGFASISNNLYMSTEDSSSSSPYLYIADPSTGVLTEVGAISPANDDFEHLAPIGDFIYAYEDISNGVWRSELKVGNRWEVIFPSSTTEVESTDTTLKLFPSRGGDEIELTRDTAITDAVVFASNYDGATAHTISVGDNLEIALYKADDTQLFEGANEAIFSELAFTRAAIGASA